MTSDAENAPATVGENINRSVEYHQAGSAHGIFVIIKSESDCEFQFRWIAADWASVFLATFLETFDTKKCPHPRDM